MKIRADINEKTKTKSIRPKIGCLKRVVKLVSSIRLIREKKKENTNYQYQE